MRLDRTGETNINKEGYNMKIKEYRSAKSIDVEFDDGTLRENVQYSAFKSGRISKIQKYRSNSIAEKRIGEENIAECGMKMRITAYRSATNIDIKFDDGIIRKGITYNQFKNGKVSRGIRGLGEIKRNVDGERMKIIRYGSSKDVDVEFSGGFIREGVSYSSFKRGTIYRYPVGEVSYTNKGEKTIIIKFRDINDMQVKFEDGYIYNDIPFSEFKKGIIKLVQGLGEKCINKDGKIMSIINYKSSSNIDVQFENGYVLRGVSYSEFKSGSLYDGWNISDIEVGEEMCNEFGELMWIKACRGVNNIDVEFEDGRVLKGVSYDDFKQGKLE